MLDFRLVNKDRTRKNYFFFTVKKVSSELKIMSGKSRNIMTLISLNFGKNVFYIV